MNPVSSAVPGAAPPSDPANIELELENATVRFGGLVALSEASLKVRSRTVHGVIGPNGAGKTTLFNVACGFTPLSEGRVLRHGRHLKDLRPHHLAGLGVSRTLQALGLFDRITVLENVMIGAERHARAGFLSSALSLPTSWRDERALKARALTALDRLGVAHLAGAYPGALPYPLRKRVALARALVSEPQLLLLDEPAGGLSHEEIEELGDLMRVLVNDMAILLVEHHVDLVMRVCDEITVLEFGKVISRGTPDEVRNDPAVLEAYLGEAV